MKPLIWGTWGAVIGAFCSYWVAGSAALAEQRGAIVCTALLFGAAFAFCSSWAGD